ncbi:hypothetical protein DFP73DRAFT_592899 [Morchella snyderi]|nr:hypothetical protein DFP73DRAFT_592899 [Morchella snyderi]
MVLIRVSTPLLFGAIAAFFDITSAAAVHKPHTVSSCKVSPADAAWPSESDWAALNTTVSGRLIKVVPLASVCYESEPDYDAEKCTYVTDNWMSASLHVSDPASIMAPLFSNNTCLPTSDPTASCTQGFYPSYAINVTDYTHAQAGINFARKNNIRLVVKNTGHDFLGKSTARGALSLWTHNLKDVTFYDSYSEPLLGYRGTAAKVGAGIEVQEAYAKANAKGVMFVGGEQKTVGFIGGYIQGGGHSPLSSKYGMAADQVLAMEVVTADGVYRKVGPLTNPDLFWALRGGGGGTFAVVISMTVRTWKDIPVTTLPLTFNSSNYENFWKAVTAFHEVLPNMADKGIYTYYMTSNTSLSCIPIFAPDMTVSEVNGLLSDFYNTLEHLGVTYNATATQYKGFYDAWYYSFGPEPAGLQSGTISRLVPRKVLEKNTEGVMSYLQDLTNTGLTAVGFSIQPEYKAGALMSLNAVNPAWRQNGLHVISGYIVPAGSTPAEVEALRDYWVTEYLSKIQEITPGAGAYLSEAAYNEPNFQQSFYGSHYPGLYVVKKLRDPKSIFYAHTGVGSEDWVETDGILCEA